MRDRLLPAAGVTAPPARVRPAATASERAAGLTLLLRDTSDPPRLAADVADVLRLADAGAIDLTGLLIAEAAGDDTSTPCGATLTVPGPGGTCDVLPPRLAPAAPPGAAARLLDAAVAFAADRGCDLVQAFADPVRGDDAAALAAAGFGRACDLLTLRRDSGTPVRESAGDRLPSVSLTPETHPRFLTVNRAARGDSRDAPRARGGDADAEFAAHEHAPGFRPDLCRLAVAPDGGGAGLILVAAGGEGGGAVWDVCYLGVAPAHRRRGVGRGLLLGRLAAARDAGAAAVTCAVDAANVPARHLYAAAGFRETGRRAVFLRRLQPNPAGGAGTGNAPSR